MIDIWHMIAILVRLSKKLPEPRGRSVFDERVGNPSCSRQYRVGMHPVTVGLM